MDSTNKIMERFDILSPVEFRWLATVNNTATKPAVTVFAFPIKKDQAPKKFEVDLSNKKDLEFWQRHLSQFPTVQQVITQALQ